jgi:hypothetical protein
MLRTLSRPALPAAAALALAAAAHAQINVPTDGSDGVLAPGSNIVIDLSRAATGVWSQPSTGVGVYDPQQWAVVFKYESVNIPAGVTVSFINHPRNAPVVWLVENDVTIAGTVTLNGANGSNPSQVNEPARPGPGGFPGGFSSDFNREGGAGFGPGGGRRTAGVNNVGSGSSANNPSHAGAGASYGVLGNASLDDQNGYVSQLAGPIYGNAGIVPLMGGSGGGGGSNAANGRGANGGGGGGAILIACRGTFTLTGQIRANGGSGGGSTGGLYGGGGGSGGGIRIIADVATGNGTLRAVGGGGVDRGGAGGGGRIRIEANENLLSELGTPFASLGAPGDPVRIWPDSTDPRLRVVSVAGLPVAADPGNQLAFPGADLPTNSTGPVPVILEGTNLPLDWAVSVRAVSVDEQEIEVPATLVGGNQALSTWQVEIDFREGLSSVSARAVAP